MATYFLNANGSETSPYDTPAKGANTIKTLLDNITQGDGDIIEVTDDGIIDDSGAAIPVFTKQMTIRSYSQNTSKPTIQLITNNYGIVFSTGANIITVTDLIFYKAGNGQSTWIVYQPTSFNTLIITGCEFISELAATSSGEGIKVDTPATFSNECRLENNKFINLYKGIFIPSGD